MQGLKLTCWRQRKVAYKEEEWGNLYREEILLFYELLFAE